MSASLGGLLKDYRLQKNISQLEIAFALGWKDPARLSRIEQGRVDKPPRSLIDRICTIMQLKPEEKNHLLLIGNYLPTYEEIINIRKEMDLFIQNWPYPAGIRDFSWRVIHTNSKLNDLFNVSSAAQKYMKEACPSVLEIIFHPDFSLNKEYFGTERQDAHKKFLLYTLKHFKYYQRARTKEKWYIELIQKMMGNDLFRELWPQTVAETQNIDNIGNFAIKKSLHPLNSKIEIKQYMFILPCLKNPRFEIELYTPADRNAFDYFKPI